MKLKRLLMGFLGMALGSCSYLPVDPPTIPGLVVKDHRDYIELSSSLTASRPVGLMFTPGGLVDPWAYVPSLGTLAARGYRVVITKTPLNLAIFQTDQGLQLARRLGGDWVAAGHSLGGTAACLTLSDYPDSFRGLVLLAAYPTEDKSLSAWTRPVLAVTGEKDGLVTPQVMAGKKPLLPPAGTGPGRTVYVEIPGGNHAQFGNYGAQDKDNPAGITPQAQWTALADTLETFWTNF